jgi:putative holliday junction resolvase
MAEIGMILALDYGERYVGVAITDPDGRVGLRHSVIDQKKGNVFGLVKDILAKEGITKILVGVPMSLEGEETQQTHVSLAFIEKLQEALGEAIDIEPVDETLTSVAAEENLIRDGVAQDQSHAEAARIILEDYLRI